MVCIDERVFLSGIEIENVGGIDLLVEGALVERELAGEIMNVAKKEERNLEVFAGRCDQKSVGICDGPSVVHDRVSFQKHFRNLVHHCENASLGNYSD